MILIKSKIKVAPPIQSDPYYQTRIWKRLRNQCRIRDMGICQPCKREGRIHAPGKYATADHIIARKQGGLDILSNVEWSCKQQHDRKRAKERN